MTGQEQGLVVRKMEEKDVGEAAEVSTEAFSDAYERFAKGYYPKVAYEHFLEEHRPEHYRAFLKDPERFSFVAEEGREIVGVALGRVFGHSGLAILNWICVRPDKQGRGIGTSLLEHVIGYCRSLGCHKLTLYTLPVLRPAVGLYLKMGFFPEAYLRREWWGVDFLKMSKWF